MADGSRDQNRTPALIANSNDGNRTPIDLWLDPTTHRLLVTSTITGSVTISDPSGDPKYGTSLALAQAASATVVTYTAVTGDKLRGFIASGNREGFFELKIDSTTILAGRIEVGSINARVTIPISKALTAGQIVDLDVTNNGQGSANFEGSILVED